MWQVVKTVCVWIVGLFILIVAVKWFVCVPCCVPEPFNSSKMSQVTVPPQTPIWQRQQQAPPPTVIYQVVPAAPQQPVIQQGAPVPFRIPSWDENWETYAAWYARTHQQSQCPPPNNGRRY